MMMNHSIPVANPERQVVDQAGPEPLVADRGGETNAVDLVDVREFARRLEEALVVICSSRIVSSSRLTIAGCRPTRAAKHGLGRDERDVALRQQGRERRRTGGQRAPAQVPIALRVGRRRGRGWPAPAPVGEHGRDRRRARNADEQRDLDLA